MLRIIVVLLLLMAMTAALGYKKFIQIQAMIAQGSILPPPISVTVAVAKAADWNKRIKAIGTLFASQGVDISSEVAGIVTSINFVSGQDVKTGKLLVVLDSRSELESLASAKAQ